MPAAGMNAAGLVVSLMWNDEAVYDRSKDAPVVTELEFIQRLLDTSGSVEEALIALRDVRIQGMVPIHLLLADSSGGTATLTPTSTGMLVHAGQDMPVPALTNTSYAALLESIGSFEGFGGHMPIPSAEALANPNSLERFVIAAEASRRAGSSPTTDRGFDALAAVANSQTRWQVVFNPADLQIAFRIVGKDRTHIVEMPEIDFRCRHRPLSANLQEITGRDFPAMLAPMDPEGVGKVTREILEVLPEDAGLGPEMADGLISGLLESATCLP